MSATRRVGSTKALSAGSMTGTTVLTATSVPLDQYDNVGILIKWTGNPNGTFVINGSVDGVTYDDLGITGVIASGAAGHYTGSLNQVPFKNVQVVYTNASGTGSLDVTFLLKGL